jgi:hypothetical protein
MPATSGLSTRDLRLLCWIGEQYAARLDHLRALTDHPIPLVRLSDHTHPPTELRIDALRGLAKSQQPAPARTAPPYCRYTHRDISRTNACR